MDAARVGGRAGVAVQVLRMRDDRRTRPRLRRPRVAGAPYRGYHAPRHSRGTRLKRATGDLDTVPRARQRSWRVGAPVGLDDVVAVSVRGG